MLAAGGVSWHGLAVSTASLFDEDLSPPFALSIPSAATIGSGFGSVPITITAAEGFAGPIALTCRPFLLFTCDVSPNPVAAGQPASLNLQYMTGTQPEVITGQSGIYTYWASTTLTGPYLVLAATVPAQTVASGGTAQYELKIATLVSGPVAIACAGLPPYAACSASPNPVHTSAAYGLDSSTLTITTAQLPSRGAAPLWPVWLLPLAGLALFGRRRWRAPAIGLLLLAGLACGGSPSNPPPPPPPATAPGTYTITVNATDPDAPGEGTLASAQITLVVQ